MKRALATIAVLSTLASPAWADSGEADRIAELFNTCLPTNWVVARSTKPVPIRGVSDPIGQFTLTDTNRTLTCDLGSGRTATFPPALILLAFPVAQAGEIEEAVEREMNRSDYPPFVFCLNDQYVFVTSPAYVNRGWHTPEAEASLSALKSALMTRMTVTYPVKPDGAANRAPPIHSETNTTPEASWAN